MAIKLLNLLCYFSDKFVAGLSTEVDGVVITGENITGEGDGL